MFLLLLIFFLHTVPPVVIHNDDWTWEYIRHQLYVEKAFDNIVISPGPGSPGCPEDVGKFPYHDLISKVLQPFICLFYTTILLIFHYMILLHRGVLANSYGM